MNHNSEEISFLPPEWRETQASEGLVDFSGDGFLIGQEESLLNEELEQGPEGLEVLCDFFASEGLKGARVLLFEPTRPDIRAAIVRSGGTYIDAGRYLAGDLNIEAAQSALKTGVSMTVFNHDDPVPEDWATPIFVDRRGRPFARQPAKDDWSLYALGSRDGLQEQRRTWIVRKGEDPLGINPFCVMDEGFDTRAALRAAHQEARLRMMVAEALELGFEAHAQAGFLWLGAPGFSARFLRQACARGGVAVLGCDHHPYRQRIRIGLPDDARNQRLFECLGSIADGLELGS